MTDARDRLLAELPEMNPGPVCRLALSGEVELANEAAERAFGAGDLVGRSWHDLSPSLTRPVWDMLLGQATSHQYEEVLGDRTFVFTAVRRAGGPCAYVYGTDITGLKAAERALEEHAAQLRELARFPEMNPGPVCRLDREGLIVLANRAAREVFDDAELVGKCWKDLCPGMDAARWEAILAASELMTHEARIGGKTLLFTHTPGSDGHLVYVYGADVTAQKAAELALRQTDKLATLGTLAAGVAHELNNPAAAAQRAATQMRGAFARLQRAQAEVWELDLPGEGRRRLMELEEDARARAARTSDLDTLQLGDREVEIERWLESHGVSDGWDLAPHLASMEYGVGDLDRVAGAFDAGAVGKTLHWLGCVGGVYALLEEVRLGAGRVSEIVTALKAYSFVGQAPIQAVNVNEGLRNTLVVLRSKLRQGVVVEQDLAELPAIQAYGSELNQVWTNLIDNAIHAMGGRGTIRIRTRREDGRVCVDIEDDGPGIPTELQSRIFDPFFTTKAPGEGTGLGLHTSYAIVVKKHGGTIDVASVPGSTRFTVALPLEAATGG